MDFPTLFPLGSLIPFRILSTTTTNLKKRLKIETKTTSDTAHETFIFLQWPSRKNLSAVCGCCAVRTASAFNDGTRASAAGANRLRERQIMTQDIYLLASESRSLPFGPSKNKNIGKNRNQKRLAYK